MRGEEASSVESIPNADARSSAGDSRASRRRRRPISLNELFWLVTLSAVTTMLTTRPGWDAHERWLLGLSLGGALLGMLVARSLGWRAWWLALGLGTLGGCVAVAIRQDWIEMPVKHMSVGRPVDYLATPVSADSMGGISIGLSVALSLLAVAVFQAIVWTTTSGEHGLTHAVRRHPRRTCAIAIGLTMAVLATANHEFLAAPGAWSPRRRLWLKEVERRSDYVYGLYTIRTGSLSCRGDWVLVETYRAGSDRGSGATDLYRLDPDPRLVRDFADAERLRYGAFDCERDRLAFLATNSTGLDSIRVLELEDLSSEEIGESPSHNWPIDSLQWLPGGSIVMHYDHDRIIHGPGQFLGGHTRLEPNGSSWRRHDSTIRTDYWPGAWWRLEWEAEADAARIVDETTARTIVTLPQPWMQEVEAYEPHVRVYDTTLSPSGRFLIVGSQIYDLKLRRMCGWSNWEVEKSKTEVGGRVAPNYVAPRLYGFTNSDLALCYHYPRRGWDGVPVIRRLASWMSRQPLHLYDPQAGKFVAQTRPLSSVPTSVAVSHDGSRMAVFVDDGVLFYDVPPRFR